MCVCVCVIQMSHRAELVQLAQVFERGNRLDDMRKVVHDLALCIMATPEDEISILERDLIYNSFKRKIANVRESFYSMREIEETCVGNERTILLSHTLSVQLKHELFKLCQEALCVIECVIEHKEHEFFFTKFKADCLRYLCEIGLNDDSSVYIEKAEKCYQDALRLGKEYMCPTLGLCLNYSVFVHEILGKPKEACLIARSAFEENPGGEPTTLQLLRDNLVKWTSC